MKKREPLGMLEAVYFIQPNERVSNAMDTPAHAGRSPRF